MSKLRLAFLGGGINSAVGNVHYAAARMDGLFEVTAGCFSTDPETNSETAERYGAEALNSIDDIVEMAEALDIDAVSILTPTPQHFNQVKLLLETGIPIICEKALSSTPEQVLELMMIRDRVRQENGKGWGLLYNTFNYTGYPMVRELQHMVLSGGLGEIVSIQAEMPQEGYLRDGSTPQEWRLTDGPIPAIHLDLGTHLHHLIHFVTGDYIAGLVALSQSKSPHKVVDDVSYMARYSTGFKATGWFGKTALGYRNGLRIRVNGTKASAEWTQTNPEELHVATCKGQRGILDRSSPECVICVQPRYQRFKVGHPAGFIEAYANLYNDLSENITHDFISPFYSAEAAYDGLSMMSVMANSGQEEVHHENYYNPVTDLPPTEPTES